MIEVPPTTEASGVMDLALGASTYVQIVIDDRGGIMENIEMIFGAVCMMWGVGLIGLIAKGTVYKEKTAHAMIGAILLLLAGAVFVTHWAG